jgi:hypothetical protein
MKDALCPRPAAGDVVAIVGKMLAGGQAGSIANDFIAFDHQLLAVRLKDHPFASEQRDGTVRLIFDGDEVDERVRRSLGQAFAAMMVDKPVQMSREARDFNRSLCHAKEAVHCAQMPENDTVQAIGLFRQSPGCRDYQVWRPQSRQE